MVLTRILIPLLFLAGCTYNQQRRIAEKWAPFDRAHSVKIIRESLDRPAADFSFHLIPTKHGYILKGSRLPVNERFLLASIDGSNGKIDLLHEFECLSDGAIQVYGIKGIRREASLSLLAHENVRVGKQIDYLLVRKKDCTFAAAHFLPYPIQAKGEHGERLSMFVTHPMLTRFILEGNGFIPNETVQLTHRSGERIETLYAEADAMGQIEVKLNPIILGKLGGDASVAVNGKMGSVDLDYPWGSKLEMATFAQPRAFSLLFAANRLPHEMDQDPYINPFFCVN